MKRLLLVLLLAVCLTAFTNKKAKKPYRNVWMSCFTTQSQANSWMNNTLLGLRYFGYYGVMGVVLPSGSGYCGYITEGGPYEQ